MKGESTVEIKETYICRGIAAPTVYQTHQFENFSAIALG